MVDPITTLVLTIASLLVITALGFRFLGAYERISAERIETERLKSAWYQQMAKANPKTNGKSSKKPKKAADDDEEAEEDPLARILDHPVARGFAAKYGIDVDGVLDGDEAEIGKVERLLKVGGGLGGGQPPQIGGGGVL